MGDIYLSWLPDVVGAALDPLHFDWQVYDAEWLYRARSSGGYDELPLCVVWHHTASNGDAWGDASYQCYTADARPISNITIDENICLILAGGATNTNGSGSNSPMDFSRGIVAVDDMNRCALGVEICNNGVGEPYPAKLIDAVFAISNAINARCGNQPTDVCTHEHYAPERKVDPSTAAAVLGGWQPRSCTTSGSWDVSDLRAECQRRSLGGGGTEGEDDMPLSDEDVQKVAKAVWDYQIDTTAKDAGIDPEPAAHWLQRSYLISRQYLGKFSGKPATDPTMLKQVDANTKK